MKEKGVYLQDFGLKKHVKNTEKSKISHKWTDQDSFGN